MCASKNTLTRNRQLNISLTEAELADVKALAEQASQRLVDYGRARILADRMSRRTADCGSATLRLVYERLGRIGASLHALLRQMEARREPVQPDLQPVLDEIRQILAERHAP